jgi:hypothetical protein
VVPRAISTARPGESPSASIAIRQKLMFVGPNIRRRASESPVSAAIRSARATGSIASSVRPSAYSAYACVM